jgi:hypothetical protein
MAFLDIKEQKQGGFLLLQTDVVMFLPKRLFVTLIAVIIVPLLLFYVFFVGLPVPALDQYIARTEPGYYTLFELVKHAETQSNKNSLPVKFVFSEKAQKINTKVFFDEGYGDCSMEIYVSDLRDHDIFPVDVYFSNRGRLQYVVARGEHVGNARYQHLNSP